MGFIAAEFGAGEVLWSFVWFVLFVVGIVVLVLAGVSVWRYVGRSNTGPSRVLLTILGVGGLAILMILPFIGLPVAIAVVFFERTSARKALMVEGQEAPEP
jgi:hypothetical protein